MTDYPQGDGIPDCPHCRGRGCISVRLPYLITPATRPCSCVGERDLLANMDRRWLGLSKAVPPKSSPLVGLEKTNLRITAQRPMLRSHLHLVAQGQSASWFFAVESDRELAKAWLYTKKFEGQVFDVDVVNSTPKYASLEDLSDHADLLVLLVGVKQARNNATPELLVDVVQGRDFLSKPTWVVDEPHYPLTQGHISHSTIVDLTFDEWPHLYLDGAEAVEPEYERLNPPSMKSFESADVGCDDDDELSKLFDKPQKPKKGKGGFKS